MAQIYNNLTSIPVNSQNLVLNADAISHNTPVRGKLLQVDLDLDLVTMEDNRMTDAQIKLELVQKIVERMFKDDMISFTKQQDPIYDKMRYRAYVYVTPNGDTELIRKALK